MLRRPHSPPPPALLFAAPLSHPNFLFALLRLFASRPDKKAPQEEEEDYLEAGFEDDIDLEEDMREDARYHDLSVRSDDGLDC